MDDHSFTPRQRDVLVEMCKGKPNKMIAKALGMAEATVKLHLTEIFKTLDVQNRSQAIIKASNLAITTNDIVVPLTDMPIMEEFTNTAFTTLDGTWSDRVLRFGQAVEKRCRNNPA